MRGALLVAGTSSHAGKSLITAGLCRWLAGKGVAVAPFKAQNMALNSGVAADGAEIGRAQLLQAAAGGVEAEAAMNPVLLKPGEHDTQVVVMGRADGNADARGYADRKPALAEVAADALADLRARYDVVVCEGAGSPAEINLRADDLANMGLARRAALPTVLVGDIDRGGVLAALYGTLALLDAADQALVSAFLVNKFRGDAEILRPGLERLEALTGRATIGVLPWRDGLAGDAEDSLALDDPAPWAADVAGHADPVAGGDVAGGADPADAAGGLDVVVVRLPRISNATDVDPLACEPGVRVRFAASPDDVVRADLVVVPGTKATVADLDWLRRRGLDGALFDRARRGAPTLGLCGGYQLLGEAVCDEVESGAGQVPALGLLPATTVFAAEKLLARGEATSPAFGGAAAAGYEIRHGRVRVHGGAPLLRAADGADEGCVLGAVLGTSWHGVLESDGFRRALLAWVAERRGVAFTAGTVSYAARREARLDALGDLVEAHVDTGRLSALIEEGAPADLPTVTGGLA